MKTIALVIASCVIPPPALHAEPIEVRTFDRFQAWSKVLQNFETTTTRTNASFADWYVEKKASELRTSFALKQSLPQSKWIEHGPTRSRIAEYHQVDDAGEWVLKARHVTKNATNWTIVPGPRSTRLTLDSKPRDMGRMTLGGMLSSPGDIDIFDLIEDGVLRVGPDQDEGTVSIVASDNGTWNVPVVQFTFRESLPYPVSITTTDENAFPLQTLYFTRPKEIAGFTYPSVIHREWQYASDSKDTARRTPALIEDYECELSAETHLAKYASVTGSIVLVDRLRGIEQKYLDSSTVFEYPELERMLAAYDDQSICLYATEHTWHISVVVLLVLTVLVIASVRLGPMQRKIRLVFALGSLLVFAYVPVGEIMSRRDHPGTTAQGRRAPKDAVNDTRQETRPSTDQAPSLDLGEVIETQGGLLPFRADDQKCGYWSLLALSQHHKSQSLYRTALTEIRTDNTAPLSVAEMISHTSRAGYSTVSSRGLIRPLIPSAWPTLVLLNNMGSLNPHWTLIARTEAAGYLMFDPLRSRMASDTDIDNTVVASCLPLYSDRQMAISLESLLAIGALGIAGALWLVARRRRT